MERSIFLSNSGVFTPAWKKEMDDLDMKLSKFTMSDKGKQFKICLCKELSTKAPPLTDKEKARHAELKKIPPNKITPEQNKERDQLYWKGLNNTRNQRVMAIKCPAAPTSSAGNKKPEPPTSVVVNKPVPIIKKLERKLVKTEKIVTKIGNKIYTKTRNIFKNILG